MGLHAKKKEQRKNFAFPKIGYKKYTSKKKKKIRDCRVRLILFSSTKKKLIFPKKRSPHSVYSCNMAVNKANSMAGVMYELAKETAAPSYAVGAALEPEPDPEAEEEPESPLVLDASESEPESELEPPPLLELVESEVLVALDESEVVVESVSVLDEPLPVVVAVDEESSLDEVELLESSESVELLALMFSYEPLVSVNL